MKSLENFQHTKKVFFFIFFSFEIIIHLYRRNEEKKKTNEINREISEQLIFIFQIKLKFQN